MQCLPLAKQSKKNSPAKLGNMKPNSILIYTHSHSLGSHTHTKVNIHNICFTRQISICCHEYLLFMFAKPCVRLLHHFSICCFVHEWILCTKPPGSRSYRAKEEKKMKEEKKRNLFNMWNIFTVCGVCGTWFSPVYITENVFWSKNWSTQCCTISEKLYRISFPTVPNRMSFHFRFSSFFLCWLPICVPLVAMVRVMQN